MHLPASFSPFCKCSMESCLSSLDAISPETNHDSVRGSPRTKAPRLLALPGVSRRDGRLSLSRTEPCLSPPFLSSPSLLRMHVVKTRFTWWWSRWSAIGTGLAYTTPRPTCALTTGARRPTCRRASTFPTWALFSDASRGSTPAPLRPASSPPMGFPPSP